MRDTLRRGQILINALLLSALGAVVLTVLVGLATVNLQNAKTSFDSEQAFQVAEAGIEYYRWHLAHAPADYTNGTGQPGPYVIPYLDKDGVQIGAFTLTITPPTTGSTIVTIQSRGTITANPAVQRTIVSKLGIPSLASFATIANDAMNFGPGTEVFGAIHSNDGIRFDGLAHNLVTSAKASYDDPDHTGGVEFGVHTHVSPVDPLPPAAVPNRPDVFMAGRDFPVPAVDFTGLTANLAQIKADAQAAGNYFAPSGSQGYEIVLKTDDTFTVHRVTSLKAPPSSNCTNAANETGWGTWSINATTTVGTYPIPANGLIFFEDHVWVSGKVSSARVTIASARFPENPSTDTSITINNDLLYSDYSGIDAIALIAQNNVNVGLYSRDFQRIDAAMVAKNGRAGRYYYRQPGSNTNCGSNALRNTLTLYGMIATNKRYGFSWSCGGVYCSGYQFRNIVYDAHLLYGPPPSFPLTTDQYQILSWEEVK
jgi:hypothetical protein